MRRLVCFLAAICFAYSTSAAASGLDKIILSLSNVSTGTAAASQTNTTSKITGRIERVDISFRVNTITVCPHVFTSNEFTGLTTTLLNPGNIGTNASYYSRGFAQAPAGYNLTNGFYKYAALDEIVYLSSTNASATNQNIKATVIYDRP